jgi:hypothetical protein
MKHYRLYFYISQYAIRVALKKKQLMWQNEN